MPDKPRDPLDEPDDLLADDEPTDSVELPEPPASALEEPPAPPEHAWEDDSPEPVPSEIEVLEDEAGEPEVDDGEPPGDDLYWADVDEEAASEPQWHEPEEQAPALDWAVEDEDRVEDEDWADLEESRMLPADRILVGLEERASLPALGLVAIPVIMDTGRTGSVLGGGAGAPIHTTIHIGPVTLSLLLERSDGPGVLRLGQDAIAARFVVDPAQRMVVSAPQ